MKRDDAVVQELIVELQEVNIRLIKLERFFDSEAFTKLRSYHQSLLAIQKMAMRQYTDVLRSRIADLTNEFRYEDKVK